MILYLFRSSKRYLYRDIINKVININVYYSNKIITRYYSDYLRDIDTLYNNLTTKKLNYYEILNISPKSSNDDIKKAFLILAKQYHPDICNDKRSRLIFMKIKEAYDKLQDEDYRRKYNQTFDKSNLASNIILTDIVDIQFDSLESEIERLERYKRYVDNERNDVLNDRFFFLKIILGTASTLAIIVYICSNLPKLVEFQAKKSGKSDVISGNDLSGDKLVNAFYNPINKQWERIIHPFQPPTPEQLYEYYSKQYPEDSIKLNKIQLPKNRLPVLKTTEQSTNHPTLLYDPYRKKLVSIEKK